jgi:hypothetical protein
VGLKQNLDLEAALAAARGIAEKAQHVAAAVAAGATAAAASPGSPVPAAGAVAPGAAAGSAAQPEQQCLLLSAGAGQRLSAEGREVWESACSLSGCLAEGSPESAALLGSGGGNRAFLEELRQVRGGLRFAGTLVLSNASGARPVLMPSAPLLLALLAHLQ